MNFQYTIGGLEKLRGTLAQKARQIPFATAQALTQIGHQVRKATAAEMQARLDRPKPYTTRQAIQVNPATKERPIVEIGLGIKIDAPSKGTPYAKALGHLFTGGSRQWKKMEGAFRRIRALPPGMQMVPGAGCPLDAWGNPPRGLIVQLIAYFNGFSEVGHKANMTDKRRARLAKAGRTASGAKTINGVQYFISHGRRGRAGDRYTEGRHDQHLAAGIWARSGIHGVVVKPVFLFVRAGSYRRYINLPAIAAETVQREFRPIFTRALANAMRTAR